MSRAALKRRCAETAAFIRAGGLAEGPEFSQVSAASYGWLARMNDLGFLMRAKLKHAGVRLSLRLDSDLPRITGDATQLEQAFLNLSLNAVDAMPGGGELMIRSRSLRPREGGAPDRLIVRFRDTGEGMSAEQQSRLFTSLLLPPAAPVEQPPEPLTSTPPRVVPATVVETPPPAPAP